MLHGFKRCHKKALLAIILLLHTTLLSGCWGHNELSELGLVLATAIDKTDNGRYQITVMAVVPSGSSIQQSDKSTVWIGSAIGDSIMDASKNLRKTATKKLSWLQNDLLIIGEKAARSGIDEIMDFILRNREIRLSTKVIVSEGNASAIFDIPSDIERNLYTEMKGMIDNTKEWSKGYTPDLNEFLNAYTCKYSGNVAGRINSMKITTKTFSTRRENVTQPEGTSNQKTIVLSGSSVFRKDKLVGFMDDDETRGYLWIVGKAEIGAVVVTDPGGKHMITMETHKAQSRIITEFEGGKPSVTVKLNLKGTLVESSGNIDFIDNKNVKNIEDIIAKQIETEMRVAVRKAQKGYKLDIFDFGSKFYRYKPAVWREIKEDWDEIFPDLEIKYDVKVILNDIGEIQNSVTGGER